MYLISSLLITLNYYIEVSLSPETTLRLKMKNMISIAVKIIKAILIISGIVFLAINGLKIIKSRKDIEPNNMYSFAELTKGKIENIVSCSGTLKAVGTVAIGTQVSGTISRIFVDYNDMVKKGGILANLDTALFESSVTEAEAGIMKATANFDQADANFRRNKLLYDKKLISEQEFLPFKTNLKISEASVLSAKAALKKAKTNFKNAYIRSPIDGTVIERNIEAGQTVAASLSTPTLFIIAEDLSQMQIEADVDESDIGLIQENQQVRFTVQAWPDKAFFGHVSQIRLNPITIQNVVNYTVVVTTTNDKNLLLPGMTATVDFVVQKNENVLLVPNAALKLKLRKEMATALQKSPKSAPGLQKGKKPLRSRKMKRLLYLDDQGILKETLVKAGITDGQLTEIQPAEKSPAREGMKIIIGLKRPQAGSKQNKSIFSKRPKGGGSMRKVL